MDGGFFLNQLGGAISDNAQLTRRCGGFLPQCAAGQASLFASAAL